MRLKDTQHHNHKNTFFKGTFHKAIPAPFCSILASNSEAIALDSRAATSGMTPTSCLHSHVNHKGWRIFFFTDLSMNGMT